MSIVNAEYPNSSFSRVRYGGEKYRDKYQVENQESTVDSHPYFHCTMVIQSIFNLLQVEKLEGRKGTKG